MDDLASVWCEAAELELAHKNFRRALELMRAATTPPAHAAARRSQAEMDGPVQVGSTLLAHRGGASPGRVVQVSILKGRALASPRQCAWPPALQPNL